MVSDNKLKVMYSNSRKDGILLVLLVLFTTHIVENKYC